MIKNNDLAFFIDYNKKYEVLEYIKEKRKIGDFSTIKNFTIISFLKQSEEKFSFEKVCGSFSDNKLSDMLKDGKVLPMPLLKVLQYYKNGGIKFYDAKPPIPYLMNILWMQIFPTIRKIEQYIDEKGKMQQRFETNLNFLTDELKEKYTHTEDHDTRQPKIPKKKWVKEAMEEFVRLGYAENDSGDPDKYIVKIKHIKDPLEKFCKEVVKGRESKADTVQKTLEGWTTAQKPLSGNRKQQEPN